MSRALPIVLAAVITTGTAGAALLPASGRSSEPRSGVAARAETAITVLPVARTAADGYVGRDYVAQLARKRAADAAAADARAAEAAAQERARKARALEAERASRDRRAVSYGDPKAIARSMLAERGWASQWGCLDSLWTKESGWRVYASNPSGAYGIPQALPGSKMASAGPDWRTNPATQIRWGLGYIAAAHGSPCGAWRHSQDRGWY